MTADPAWRGTRRVLLLGGSVYSLADPFATAMLVDGETIAWVGSEGAALAMADGVDEVVDLAGSLVAPGFVDAHVHLTATGLQSTGIDLAGASSGGDILDRVARAAGRGSGLLHGHGFENDGWPLPSAAELDRAAGGRPVVLHRVDMHSVLVGAAFLAEHPELTGMPGHSADGLLRGAAAYRAAELAMTGVGEEQRRTAQAAARSAAAAAGIVLLHEMGGPQHGGRDDFRLALAGAAQEPGPLVVGYWAELEGAAAARELGAAGLGGDLVIDGALGSRTAALREPYTDDPGNRGTLYLTEEQVAAHVRNAVAAGMPASFHAIGDAAVATALAGFAAAGDLGGLPHRLEHAEGVTPDLIAPFADLGIIASVQPVFDARWGGTEGMYAERLGDRAAEYNPLAALAAAGVPLALGSDSPVTPLDPWAAIGAAVNHHNREQSISGRAAFAAHTRGGWRAAGLRGAGALVPGAPAHYAVWGGSELVVLAPDDRIQAWSTDPRSGTPGLPDVSPGAPRPRCQRTVVAGATVYDDGSLAVRNG